MESWSHGVIMKYSAIFLILLLVSCTNAAAHKKDSYISKIDFDVPAGEYEQFQLSTWDQGANECIEFSLNKPYNNTRWLASVMLYIKGESKDLSKIILHTEHKDSKSLLMEFEGGHKEEQVFGRAIKFGEAVKFKASFPNDHTIKVTLSNSEFVFPVDYKIQSLLIGTSSANATIKLFDTSLCNQ